MKTFNTDILPYLDKIIFENLNKLFLFNTSWYTPKFEDGSYYLYLFKSGLPFKTNDIIISHSGNVKKGTWEVVSGNLIIDVDGVMTMFKTKIIDQAIILQMEGTNEFLVLFNKKACPNGAPTLDVCHNYFSRTSSLSQTSEYKSTEQKNEGSIDKNSEQHKRKGDHNVGSNQTVFSHDKGMNRQQYIQTEQSAFDLSYLKKLRKFKVKCESFQIQNKHSEFRTGDIIFGLTIINDAQLKQDDTRSLVRYYINFKNFEKKAKELGFDGIFCSGDKKRDLNYGIRF